MRKHAPSRGEIEAWKQLRSLRAEGYAFRREHKLGAYWTDFVCLRKKLIVEIDGPLHDTDHARKHDADGWLRAEGFEVMRFKERAILGSAYWLGDVRGALQRRPDSGYRAKRPTQRTPHPLPPPPLGEGETGA